jgi:glycosyltransferase involved in cell wall biosynthesis
MLKCYSKLLDDINSTGVHMKIAVISAYYKEERELLERCLNSVKEQTIKCDHFLVSDGHPQEWLKKTGIRHIELGESHNDYGNTPRGLGAQLAISEGYDAICFLDSDNWFDKNHVEHCLESAIFKYPNILECDYVIAKRRLCRPNLTTMDISEEPGLVDTNCFFFLPGSYFLIPFWNLMPKEFSNIGDRIFYKKIISSNLNFAINNIITVNYLNLWSSTYEAIGETPPDDAKPNVDGNFGFDLFKNKTNIEKIIIQRMIGLSITYD